PFPRRGRARHSSPKFPNGRRLAPYGQTSHGTNRSSFLESRSREDDTKLPWIARYGERLVNRDGQCGRGAHRSNGISRDGVRPGPVVVNFAYRTIVDKKANRT